MDTNILRKFSLTKLKNPSTKATTAQNLEDLSILMQNIESKTVAEEKWMAIRNALLETQAEDIGFQTQTIKQP